MSNPGEAKLSYISETITSAAAYGSRYAGVQLSDGGQQEVHDDRRRAA